MTQPSEAPKRASPLETTVASITFQNPVLLAAGTAEYGREVADVMRLESLGGLVTKAVSLEPRSGAAAPKVTEFPGGMMNAVGLANPGANVVKTERLPWLATNLRDARVIVNVVGFEIDHFARVVQELDASPGFQAFELNLSCPNTKAGGLEFGADPASLSKVVSLAREKTQKPLFVKLSPSLQDISAAARAAADSGANGLTLVNTMPGMLIDTGTRKPILGFGSGGVSGNALLPIGILATWRVSRAVSLPIIGVGGISRAEDALQYVMAGASLVAIGTAAMRDPRVPERVVRGLREWCEKEGIASLMSVVGSLDWK